MTRSKLKQSVERLKKVCEEFLNENPEKKKEAKPEIGAVIKFWCAEHEKHFGKYLVLGKDAAAIKRALGTFNTGDIERAILGFLASKDPFYQKNRSISFFCTKIPEFNKPIKVHQQHCPFCLIAVPGDFMAHIQGHKKEVFKP